MASRDQPVEVITKHTLQCANKAALESLESTVKIGPLDQLLAPFIPIAVLYVYKAPAIAMPGTDIIPVERLRRALSALLDYYPHLTGRIHIEDKDGTPEINCLGTGGMLLEARCSAPLDVFCSHQDGGRILVTNLPASGLALLAPFDISLESVCRDPIFTVQHTRFACGGVALGIRLPHNLCDAAGFIQLVRNLATLYRSIRARDLREDCAVALDRPPHIRSYMAESTNMTPEDRQTALVFQPSLFSLQEESAMKPLPEKTTALSSPEPTPPSIIGRVLRFSGRELDALKMHAMDPNGGWISTFDALSAHIHQSVYRARLKMPNVSPEELHRDFLTPVNVREPLGLPSEYFPNALFTPSDVLPHDMLANGSLWQVAKAIHDITRLFMTPQEMRSTLSWIAAQPDKRRIRGKFGGGKGSVMISQWSKFNTYSGVDFDVDAVGKAIHPVLVSPPFTPIWLMCDGLAYFLSTEDQLQRPAPGNTLAIDVNLSLSEPLWAILDKDENFREFRD